MVCLIPRAMDVNAAEDASIDGAEVDWIEAGGCVGPLVGAGEEVCEDLFVGEVEDGGEVLRGDNEDGDLVNVMVADGELLSFGLK